jgi:hypothetical protein
MIGCMTIRRMYFIPAIRHRPLGVTVLTNVFRLLVNKCASMKYSGQNPLVVNWPSASRTHRSHREGIIVSGYSLAALLQTFPFAQE